MVKKVKIPPPGAKGEESTNFYTRKKWRTILQYSHLSIAGRCLDPRGATIVGCALSKNHYVHKLDLSNNNLGDEGVIVIADVLRINSLIQALNLSHNGITDIGGIALASCFIPTVEATGVPGKWNRTLMTLILMGNQLGDDTLLALSNAAACHRDLTSVDLSWNQVGPQGTKCMMRCLQRSPNCSFLLAANRLGDEGTMHLCEALKRYGSKGHVSLNLYRNDIGHRGAAAVGKLLENNNTLHEVNLSGNTLGLKGMQALRHSLTSGTNTLRSLNVADTLIGDEGAVEVAGIIAADLPLLERLNISENRITDKGAAVIIASLLKNSHLVLVKCAWNTFGGNAASALSKLVRETKTLKSLDVSHCIGSAEQRRNLTLAVGESDGVHVDMGEQQQMDDAAADVQSKIEEYLTMKADLEAQQKANNVKKGHRKKKKAAS